jgi:protein TonB
MPKARREDTPWRRLPWLLPAALLLSIAGIAGFLALLSSTQQPRPAPAPIELQLVELLPPAVPPSPPPPEPIIEAPPPEPEPMLEPAPELPPPAPPPPVRLPRPRPTPPRPAPPVAAQAAPMPAPPIIAPPAQVTAPPGGGTMAARAIAKPLPDIPDELRRRVLSLTALARFRIAASGFAEVELIEATPDPTVNRILLESLRRWRFFPALADGMPVASVQEIRIQLSVR